MKDREVCSGKQVGEATAGIREFAPPSPRQMHDLLRLARWYFRPEFLGLEELDLRRPALFVGNHTLYGLMDAALMIEHLYTQHGVLLRGLGDRGHFKVPGWRALLVKCGMVLGTPENCSTLMNARQSILVFPGGGREVMRRKGEAYQLVWKQRAGFARLAIAHGYDIIPFGSVGPDETFKILLDANDIMHSRLWKWLRARNDLTRGGDMLPPIIKGIGPTLLPRPQRFYFGFGRRISTARLQGQEYDPAVVWEVRNKTARAVRRQIARLIRHRAEDRQRSWSAIRKWLAPLDRSVGLTSADG